MDKRKALTQVLKGKVQGKLTNSARKDTVGSRGKVQGPKPSHEARNILSQQLGITEEEKENCGL